MCIGEGTDTTLKIWSNANDAQNNLSILLGRVWYEIKIAYLSKF